MKKPIFTILVFVIAISSCAYREIEDNCNYHEIDNKKIKWSEIFCVDLVSYYVFFFTPVCKSCSEICRKIINFSNKSYSNVFFVESSKETVIGSSCQNLIGINNINDFYIEGFPTLIFISNKTITKVFLGVSSITYYLY